MFGFGARGSVGARPEGRLVVVDVKTGKSPVTKDDAQRHAQLGLYQLAVAEGACAEGDQPGGQAGVHRQTIRIRGHPA